MRVFVAACMLALLASACGGGSNRARTVDPTKQAQNSASPTAQNATAFAPQDVDSALKGALLTVDEMPTGWSTGTDDSSNDDSQICNKPSEFNDITTSSASVTYEKGTVGPFFIEAIARPDIGADKALNALREVAQGCAQWSETDSSGSTTSWHIAPLSFPKIGDDTFAFRMSSDPTFIGAADLDFICIRRGSLLLVAAYAQIGFSGIDSGQTEALVRKADDKFAPVARAVR